MGTFGTFGKGGSLGNSPVLRGFYRKYLYSGKYVKYRKYLYSKKYGKYRKYAPGVARGQDASDSTRLYRPLSLMMVGCCSRPMGS